RLSSPLFHYTAGRENAQPGLLFFARLILEGVIPPFAGADLDDVLDVVDEDLAVTDVAGVKGPLDGLDQRLDRDLADDDVNLDLRQQPRADRTAAEVDGMPLLGAVAEDVGHGDAGD